MLFLRQCDKSDVTSAAQMLCIVYSELPQNESWQLDRAEKRIEMYISGEGRRGYALTMENETIGYLFGRKDFLADKDVFYVDELFVHPRYQRKGCGSLAMGELERELKKEGVSRIELHPIADDISFYKKNGFSTSSYVYLEKEI